MKIHLWKSVDLFGCEPSLMTELCLKLIDIYRRKIETHILNVFLKKYICSHTSLEGMYTAVERLLLCYNCMKES